MNQQTVAKAELLRLVDEGWRRFRASVRHLGWAGMGQRTPTGWTYKDLVAHTAAWEEEAARRLRAFRDSRDVPDFGGDAAVDAFNARVIEERRLVGAEAIVDELDTAHRQLVALIRELPEELLRDERAQRWVGANTFAHYAEHGDELAAAHSPR